MTDIYLYEPVDHFGETERRVEYVGIRVTWDLLTRIEHAFEIVRTGGDLPLLDIGFAVDIDTVWYESLPKYVVEVVDEEHYALSTILYTSMHTGTKVREDAIRSRIEVRSNDVGSENLVLSASSGTDFDLTTFEAYPSVKAIKDAVSLLTE